MTLGLAQKRFLEFHKGPFKIPKVKWPFIDSLLHKSDFDPVDRALAEKLLENYIDPDESIALSICFLSRAAREGHICIQLYDNKISPSFSKEIDGLAVNGFTQMPADLISIVKREEECPTPICRYGNLIYFNRNWQAETLFLKHLDRLKSVIADSPLVPVSGNLLPQQQSAVEAAFSKSLTLICGGPGTGKTYTAGQFIRMFWESLSEMKKKDFRIVLAAPTGKAAGNLMESIAKAIQGMSDPPKIEAKTLHSLLGIKKSRKREDDEELQLPADLIVVDECSMIDLELMLHLFRSVKSGARLILLGDRHQLPSIGSGAIFSNLMQLLPENSVELTQCMRTDNQKITSLSASLREGNLSSLDLYPCKDVGDLKPYQLHQQILDYALPKFLNIFASTNPELLLQKVNQFRILTPLKQGALGTDTLNLLLLKKMLTETDLHIPIMIAQNDSSLDLANGDIGVLVKRFPYDLTHVKEGDRGFFYDRTQSKIREFPALLLPHYEYAYCLSVHKSQGSEYDEVLLLLPEGSEQFGREMLYTAVTRAKKELNIWGSRQILEKTVQKHTVRQSGIRLGEKK